MLNLIFKFIIYIFGRKQVKRVGYIKCSVLYYYLPKSFKRFNSRFSRYTKFF